MKNIFYCSNAHKELFSDNTRSNFNSYIDISDLNYLYGDDDDIEATIKSITFDNKKSFKTNGALYGIRSNISNPTIRSNSYDNVISLFVENNTNDVEHVEFRNPPFFNTRKELLSRAQFQIVDVNTNLSPNFSTGSPTYIQVVIKKSVPRMKKPFNIFLDSSCPKSKALYPNNNNMEFTIDLPERLSFNRHWQVTLKSLFIPNKILHLDDCYIRYYYYNWTGYSDLGGYILKITSLHHTTIETFCINSIQFLNSTKLKYVVRLLMVEWCWNIMKIGRSCFL